MATATAIKFNTAYGPKTPVRTSMEGQKTRTHQSGKDECDINKIMARYVKTGVLDHQKEYGGDYGFCTSMDLLEALTTVQKANDMFAKLPATVRTKFSNDAGQFLDFVQDPENKAELIEMGLAKKVSEEDPVAEIKVPKEPEAPVEGASDAGQG